MCGCDCTLDRDSLQSRSRNVWNLVQAGRGDGRMSTLGQPGEKAAVELCLVPFSQNALARGAVHSASPSGDEKVVLMHFIAGP